jgi:predicted metalloprotease
MYLHTMSRFLKLTNIIINKNFIQHIHINKDNFIIHMMSNKMSGSYIFGRKDYHSCYTEVLVCKTEHSNDYKTVTDWIDNELN